MELEFEIYKIDTIALMSNFRMYTYIEPRNW